MTEKEMSEHFTKFVTNKETFDFNAFKTKEEFDAYKEEVENFIKENKNNNV